MLPQGRMYAFIREIVRVELFFPSGVNWRLVYTALPTTWLFNIFIYCSIELESVRNTSWHITETIVIFACSSLGFGQRRSCDEENNFIVGRHHPLFFFLFIYHFLCLNRPSALSKRRFRCLPSLRHPMVCTLIEEEITLYSAMCIHVFEQVIKTFRLGIFLAYWFYYVFESYW